jgi:hypothetical protein
MSKANQLSGAISFWGHLGNHDKVSNSSVPIPVLYRPGSSQFVALRALNPQKSMVVMLVRRFFTLQTAKAGRIIGIFVLMVQKSTNATDCQVIPLPLIFGVIYFVAAILYIDVGVYHSQYIMLPRFAPKKICPRELRKAVTRPSL